MKTTILVKVHHNRSVKSIYEPNKSTKKRHKEKQKQKRYFKFKPKQILKLKTPFENTQKNKLTQASIL